MLYKFPTPDERWFWTCVRNSDGNWTQTKQRIRVDGKTPLLLLTPDEVKVHYLAGSMPDYEYYSLFLCGDSVIPLFKKGLIPYPEPE